MWQSALLDVIYNIVSKYFKDKEKAKEISKNILSEILSYRRDVIVAETKSESWITRSWRPITILSFVALIILYFTGFINPALDPAIVNKILNIIEISIYGYIGSRGLEKIVANLRK